MLVPEVPEAGDDAMKLPLLILSGIVLAYWFSRRKPEPTVWHGFRDLEQVDSV